jgi:hypothetical protein
MSWLYKLLFMNCYHRLDNFSNTCPPINNLRPISYILLTGSFINVVSNLTNPTGLQANPDLHVMNAKDTMFVEVIDFICYLISTIHYVICR